MSLAEQIRGLRFLVSQPSDHRLITPLQSPTNQWQIKGGLRLMPDDMPSAVHILCCPCAERIQIRNCWLWSISETWVWWPWPLWHLGGQSGFRIHQRDGWRWKLIHWPELSKKPHHTWNNIKKVGLRKCICCYWVKLSSSFLPLLESDRPYSGQRPRTALAQAVSRYTFRVQYHITWCGITMDEEEIL